MLECVVTLEQYFLWAFQDIVFIRCKPIAFVQELEAAFHKVPVDDLLHLVFLVLLEHPFEICDWGAWSCIFQGLSNHHRRVAAAVGVTKE